MKKFYLAFCLIFIGYSGYSQYQIDFDSFTTGDVSNQSTYLELWPDPTASPTDPQVTTAYSFSTPHSMNVRELSGGVEDDILFNLGNKDSGIWVVKWMMYVPTGKVGYWNIQENASINPIVQHNNEIFVGSTASGGTANVITYTESNTTSTYTVSYPSDSWFEVITTIDFNTTEISIEIDGNSLITNHTYPGLQLGAIDFYSVDLNTSFFIDDFKLYEFCYEPTNVNVSNITPTTADFSWTASSTETDGYSWLLINAGDDPLTATPLQSGTTATGITNISLTNLTPETDYDFYVLGDCGINGDSNLSTTFNFQTPTTCLAPSNLSLVTTSDTTAEVTWFASPDESNGYEWYVYSAGSDINIDSPIQTSTIATGTSTLTITNLSANTAYDFYLSADCNADGISKLEGPLSFITNCGAYSSFPFYEDFESTSSSLSCWSQIQEDGTANWTFEEGSSAGSITTAYSGLQNARFVSVQSINSPITKLVSPIFDLTSLNNPTLSFYYGQENYAGDQNEMKVYYRESSTSSWIEIANYTGNVDNWTQEILLLPNPSSSYQIAFEGINYFGRANVLDDILIEDNLSLNSNSIEIFNYYPNPVKSSMTFVGKSIIKNIQFINILGKEEMNVFPNKTEVNLSLGHLSSGIYFAKVNIGDTYKTIKIIKK